LFVEERAKLTATAARVRRAKRPLRSKDKIALALAP
jgi:hypothetical protein